MSTNYSANEGDYILAVSGRSGDNTATGISLSNATILSQGNISTTGKMIFARANGDGLAYASWANDRSWNGNLLVYKVSFE